MYFIYGEAELAYLRRKDKRLAAVIDRIGPVERTVDPDLFSAVVHHIIGQQISMKAQATIWQRMQDTLGSVSAETILAAGVPAHLIWTPWRTWTMQMPSGRSAASRASASGRRR